MKQFANNVILSVARIGADSNDEDDVRLKKSLLVLGSVLFMFAGFIWGIMYYSHGARLAGAIPFSYGIVSLLSIILFAVTRRYRIFRFSQLIFILFLPFLLMLALGGYFYGSAVILWALICPMGATLFDEPRNASRWFAGFCCLVIIAGLLQSQLDITPPLSLEAATFFFVVNLLGVGTIIFLMILYFVDQKNVFQQQSENLLLNILPKEIATILRGEHRTIANHFEGASVLFADLVDFTTLSATMTPGELVGLLDDVFSYFDGLTEKYQLEKIKTIGDCYMVASGIPRPRPDHAQVLTRMALEMSKHVEQHKFRGRKLTFRIGISSGPVVAGVIGRKKFTYDLWGDVVNTASRMESHGQGGRIQITGATHEIIRNEFSCEPQGLIDVKGLGATETWFVTGQRTSGKVRNHLKQARIHHYCMENEPHPNPDRLPCVSEFH